MKALLVGVLVAVVGLTVGGVVRAVTASDTPAEAVAAVGSADVRDCPSGEILESYTSGSRVYAVARTESSKWIQVRDLAAPDRVVWISAADVEMDDEISSLPVGVCPEYGGVVTALSDTTTTTTVGDTTTTTTPGDTTTTTTPGDTTTTTSSSTTTTSAPTTTSSSTTTTSSTTPPDTTPPVIQQPSVAPNEIWEEDTNVLSCPANTKRESDVSVQVTDDVGVASVRASWTIGGTADSATLGLSQGVYSMTFGPYESPTVTDKFPYGEDVTVTVRALDAVGNESKIAVSVRVNSVWECFG
jgi:hypothetical protein